MWGCARKKEKLKKNVATTLLPLGEAAALAAMAKKHAAGGGDGRAAEVAAPPLALSRALETTTAQEDEASPGTETNPNQGSRVLLLCYI